MFALMIEYNILPKNLDAASGIWNNYFLPMAKEYGGFVAGFFMVDRKNGKAKGVEIWEDRISAKRFEQTGLIHQITSEFYDLISENPVKNYLDIEACEFGGFLRNHQYRKAK